jgi:hypothetical protein
MTTRFWIILAGLLATGCASISDGAGADPHASPLARSCAANAVASTHQVNTGGRALSYKACAGTLTITGADGKPKADLFYTAYMLPDAKADRPITFVWNGGPGADSRLLHFQALGPKLIEDGVMIDNSATPLTASDLVFLDPAGTGFSRARQDAQAPLYGTLGDIDATSRFVTEFLQVYRRENSHVYLFGESFGTWRAAGTAEALARDGVSIAGIGLISGGIPLGEMGDRALMRALSLPNRTATALALGKLDPDLAETGPGLMDETEQWAREVWYPALSSPDSLDVPGRAKLVAELARYHGMSPTEIDEDTLWVSPLAFRKGVLEGRTLDVFDMRRIEAAAGEDSGEGEAILRYYRESLGYRERLYAGIEAPAIPVGENWQYDQAPITEASLARAMAGEGPPSPSQPWTLRVMEMMPDLRTFVAAGVYDSLNSCAANRATVRLLPEGIEKRVSLQCYPGGHMMYDSRVVRDQFGNDIVAFIRNSKPDHTGHN